MTCLPKYIRNYLIVVSSADYLQQLYKMCMKNVKNGGLVVLITSQYYDFSKLLDELFLNKDELKNFVIMHFKTMDDIIRKLLLLHSWSLMPSMVAVDLSQLLRLELEACSSSSFIMQKIALCTVSLLAYLQSVVLKLPKVLNSGKSPNLLYGLLILPSEGENFGATQIQTLKDLYFYQTGIYHNLERVQTLMQEKSM